LIVLVLFVLLFGRGKISGVMGDVAKGIKSFKTGMADDGETSVAREPNVIEFERLKRPSQKSAARAKTPRKQASG
jgi:sec-independent protein translocase protein TatA